ncbi:MAG: efflux RND transporter periplasmic adaptor subunit [Candidatus Atribacteria bacterium]|nr:efflux RND transporter periplasmic adaptor subunit [Candidatus Atribacteria bacterium]
MRITGRKVFYVVLITVIGLLIVQAANRISQKRQEVVIEPAVQSERMVPIQVTRVQHGEIKSFLTVSGVVEPKEMVRVFAKIMGQVKEVSVQEGEQVEKGAILMRLDDEQIRLQVAQAKANLDSAHASLERIKAGARPQEVSQAEAGVRQAKISLDSAEENYQKMQKLFTEGAISEQQHDQAKNQYEIAKAQYQSVSESYKLITEGASSQDIKAVEAQVRQAQSALELAQSQLNSTIIKAPISGSVTAVSVKTGELASSAMPLLSIIDVSELSVKTGISEKDIGAVQLGQDAEIFIDAYPQKKFSGEIVSKGVVVDPVTKTMEIKIRVKEADIDIPPGVFARANIIIEDNPDALIIPSSALTRKADGLYVFVLGDDEKTVKRRAITTGITQDNQVEVVNGITGNEIIVILGNISLEEGDLVRVANREVLE